MKIGLISDTHVPEQLPELPFELLDSLSTVDMILHAGDLVSLEVVSVLDEIAETVAVHGNVDEPEVIERLPRKQVFALEGHQIGLIHGNRPAEVELAYLKPDGSYDFPEMESFYQYLAGELPEADIIIFGHFHIPVVRRWEDRLLVNPGSVAPHRGRQTFGLLELRPSSAQVEIIDLLG